MSNRMKYSAVSRGNPMQIHRAVWKIVPQGAGAPAGDRKLATSDIPAIRRLLRTDMNIEEISKQFSVSTTCLKSFIKRRQICNLRNRAQFISLQRSLRKEDA